MITIILNDILGLANAWKHGASGKPSLKRKRRSRQLRKPEPHIPDLPTISEDQSLCPDDLQHPYRIRDVSLSPQAKKKMAESNQLKRAKLLVSRMLNQLSLGDDFARAYASLIPHIQNNVCIKSLLAPEIKGIDTSAVEQAIRALSVEEAQHLEDFVRPPRVPLPAASRPPSLVQVLGVDLSTFAAATGVDILCGCGQTCDGLAFPGFAGVEEASTSSCACPSGELSGSSSVKGPCPALNTLANHGSLPRKELKKTPTADILSPQLSSSTCKSVGGGVAVEGTPEVGCNVEDSEQRGGEVSLVRGRRGIAVLY